MFANRSLTLFGPKPFLAVAYWRFPLLLGCLFFRCYCIPPSRLIGTVTPCPRAIESMHAEFVELLHLVDPVRVHPIGVIMGGLCHFRHPQLASQHVARNALG